MQRNFDILAVADVQVDGAANSAFSLHDKHYPQFQQAKDQYLKVVEEKVSSLRENGIKGTVGQAADAVSARTNSAVTEAKKLPGFVNKQTEVALDRVEDAFNQVSSWPIGEPASRPADPLLTVTHRYRQRDTNLSTVCFLYLQSRRYGDRPSPQQIMPGSSTLAYTTS